MIQFSIANSRFAGPGGTLPILEDDEISRKLGSSGKFLSEEERTAIMEA